MQPVLPLSEKMQRILPFMSIGDMRNLCFLVSISTRINLVEKSRNKDTFDPLFQSNQGFLPRLWNRLSHDSMPAIQSRPMGFCFKDTRFIVHTNIRSRKAANIQDGDALQIWLNADEKSAGVESLCKEMATEIKPFDDSYPGDYLALAPRMQFHLKNMRPMLQITGQIKKLQRGAADFADAEQAYMAVHPEARRYINSNNVIFAITPTTAVLHTRVAEIKM